MKTFPTFCHFDENFSYIWKVFIKEKRFIAINCQNGCGQKRTWLTLPFILPILTSSRVKAKLVLGFFYLSMIWLLRMKVGELEKFREKYLQIIISENKWSKKQSTPQCHSTNVSESPINPIPFYFKKQACLLRNI